MTKLLYIESSPRKKRSSSIMVAKAFLDAYRKKNPGQDVETLDLWSVSFPEFDGDIIEAKYRILHGQEASLAEQNAWKAVVDVFARFNCADKYLFSVPMWNFGIPYKLKHFIDLVVQPGLAFSFDSETGYNGLVTGKSAVVIYSRGGSYRDEAARAFDFQKPYFETFLNFIGITDIRSIVVEPTLDRPENVEKTLADARKAAEALAAEF
jgi:FMN-dependent NADH-azoreductase